MNSSHRGRVVRERERSGAAMISLLLRWVGPGLCYFGAPFVTLVYFLTGRQERRALQAFHVVSSGAGSMRALALAYLNFLRFALSMMDRLFALRHGRIPPMRLAHAFDVGTLDRGAIFIGAHFGDWMLCGQVFSTRAGEGLKVNVVIDLGANPGFAAQAGNLENMGARIIDASNGTLGLLLDVKRALDDREIVCFLADRGPKEGRVVRLPFFGRDAAWHLGPFEIAARFGKPLVGFTCVKKGWSPGAVHEVTLEVLWDGRDVPEAPSQEGCEACQLREARPSPETLLQRYVATLEKQVAGAPTHWFNFYPFWTNLEGNGRNLQ